MFVLTDLQQFCILS